MTCLSCSRTNRPSKKKRRNALCHFYYVFFLCLILSVLAGCAVPGKKKQATSVQSSSFQGLQKKYQEHAATAERRGDLYRASFYWWILANLQPYDLLAKDRAAALLASSQQKAEQHYQVGLVSLSNNNSSGAQKEFLNSLNYNPRHSDALNMLKNIQGRADFHDYWIKTDENLHSIVMGEYQNEEMVAVIANFNDRNNSDRLKAGSSIKLITREGPYLLEKQVAQDDAVDSYQEVDSSFTLDILQRATKSYRSKNYSNAMSLAEMVLKDIPDHQKARELFNQSGYQLAMITIANGNHLKALRLLEALDDDYGDVRELKASLQQDLQQNAEKHYRKGVKYFLAEELAAAKNEWETTLSLNPQHKKAVNGLEKVRKLLDRLNTLE